MKKYGIVIISLVMIIAIVQSCSKLEPALPADDQLLDGTIRVLIELRKKARVDKNFALSDKIRDDLKAIGVQLKDGKDGEITYSIE